MVDLYGRLSEHRCCRSWIRFLILVDGCSSAGTSLEHIRFDLSWL